MGSKPPQGLPRYRLLTGPDDRAFCERVSEALDLGFQLYGPPAITHGASPIAAQAVIWVEDDTQNSDRPWVPRNRRGRQQPD